VYIVLEQGWVVDIGDDDVMIMKGVG